MTDKQIIDGVDVSGCDFYDKNKKYCLTLKMDTTGFKNPSCFSGDFQKCIQDSKVCPYTFCDNNHNCYYKQLKRKEQECEKLKKIIDEAKNSKLDLNSFFAIEATVGEYQLELDQLKADNEELKKRFKKFHDRKLDENADLLCKVYKEECLKFKAEQKLKRIRDIANELYESEENCEVTGTCYEILKIIDEVEEKC